MEIIIINNIGEKKEGQNRKEERGGEKKILPILIIANKKRIDIIEAHG